jgi:3-phenylpropionate/trans-cinnamate dioxygenase ferredoxin reductase component
MGRVVIVGGGLAALRSAESLRSAGFGGPLTIVGDEPWWPYNRPPLSKEALASGVDIPALEFRRRASLDDVEWRLRARAVAADLATGRITLEDASELDADGLVIASGIRPRRLPIPGPAEGRFVLRTAQDATRLHTQLRPGSRVLILGAGFIGCEVAATARGLGCEVTVVAVDDEPMERPLGPELGSAMRRRHERHGVRFLLGRTIDAFSGDAHVTSASLSDGTELPADVVVEAVGSDTSTSWLEGNGLDLSDGVLVDSALQVSGSPMPAVAAGDIARFPHPLGGSTPRRIEHWSTATDTGRRAGATLAALLAGQQPDRAPLSFVPSFWSDQYDHTLQSFGLPGSGSHRVVLGDPDQPCIVEYSDEVGLVGVVGVDRTQDVARYRATLSERIGA